MITRLPTATSAKPRRARIRGLIVGAIAATFVLGCSGPTSAEQAADSLASGLVAQAAGDLTLATADYLSCLEQEALNAFCLYNLGVIGQQQNRLAEAENDYRLALVSNPDFGAAIFNLAIIRTQAGAQGEAISLYRHYIEVEPASAKGYLNLGLLLRTTGDNVNAELALTKAGVLDPTLRIPAASSAPTPTATAAPTPSPAVSPASSGLVNASPEPSPLD